MRVWIADIISAIELFNQSLQKNPYGELVPDPDHSPLTFELRTGEPPYRHRPFSEYPRLEVPYFTEDRNEDDQREVMTGYFDTEREHLFPMTKQFVERTWYRVYKFNVTTGAVEDVKLLVWPQQDTNYKSESAEPWLSAEEKLGPIAKDGFCFVSETEFTNGTRPNIVLAGKKLPSNSIG